MCVKAKKALNEKPSVLPTLAFFHLCPQSRDQMVCSHSAKPSGEEQEK